MFEFKKATRKKSKLRLAIQGAAGAGKTLGALKLARGLAAWEDIFVIDSEHASADLYAHLGQYNTCTISAPYTPLRYVEAIKAAINAGAKVIIVDSLSHAWEGEGGALDMVDKAAASSRSGNSYTAWKEVTPQHRTLVETLLQSPVHVICTLRSKQEYVLEKDERTGKTAPKKVGMAPIQRAGMEYEFTVYMDVSEAHTATATKDRTGIFDGKTFQLNEAMGQELNTWLESGADVAPDKTAEEMAKSAAEAEVRLFAEHSAAIENAKDAESLKAAFVKGFKAKLSAEYISKLTALKDARKAALEANQPTPAKAA